MEAMEVLEMLCDLLLARSGLLEVKWVLPPYNQISLFNWRMSYRHCDPAIQEAVHTIIYAASRSEIKELVQVGSITNHSCRAIRETDQHLYFFQTPSGQRPFGG